MASANDIVSSAARLLGAPYRTWYEGASIPMWLDDGYGLQGNLPPDSYFFQYGIECSDLINFALLDNGLDHIYGTLWAGSYLQNTSYFDPSTPGQTGAVAYLGYTGAWEGGQGHIALYWDEYYLIQALHSDGVTYNYTDAESYSWGGDTAFDTYGFLPGVDYWASDASTTTTTQQAAPYVAIDSNGWFRYNGPDWSQG